MWDFVSLSLEISIQLFFFPLLFLCYCCSFLVYFKNRTEYQTMGTAQLFIPLTRFLLSFEKFSSEYEVPFYFFFHLRLFDGIGFKYSQVLVIFLFFKCSDSFLIWQFYSFHYLSFPIFHYEPGKFHFYTLVVYSYRKYQSFQFLV